MYLVAGLPEAIFSNSLEQLLSILIEDIRLSSSSSLLKACIVVPSTSLRAWLIHELSKNDISLLRVEILLVEEAVDRSSSETSSLTHFHLTPALLAFLSHQAKGSQYHLMRRLRIPFAVRAFLGTTRGFTQEEEELWNTFEQWCPLRIPSVHHKEPISSSAPLFLFGFSSLNPLLLNQFVSVPLLSRLYLLSPCMLFWEDQSSDREIRFLLASASSRKVGRPSLEQLEQFLCDRHRLLANSGQIGREFIGVIEDSRLQTQSKYVLQKRLCTHPYDESLVTESVVAIEEEPLLLDYVKADLLLLIGKRDTPQHIPKDRSIEVHGAPTPLREVEALYERMAALPNIPPASVLVLVTDMTRYQAAFEQVFGGRIPYQIWGKTEGSGPICAFDMIIHLLMSKGDLHDWQQLLRHPVIQAMLQIADDEAEALIEWLSSGSLRWGLSSEQKQRYLASRGIRGSSAQTTSLSEEKEALLGRLLSPSVEEIPEVSLLRPIGNFFRFCSLIEGWWKLPLQSSEQAPMDDFATLFQNLLQELMKGSNGGFEEEALLASVSSFRKISSDTFSPSLPTSEALRIFFQCVDSHLSRSLLHLSSPIIVAPFGSFQPFPSQLVAILGAGEGALPQHSEEQFLLRLDKMMPKVPASNVFFDRYAFLEALLSAKNLFITYQSYAFDTREQIPYSPIVADLLCHLDANYRIDAALPSHLLVVVHPLKSASLSFAHALSPSSPLLLTKNPPSSSLTISYLQRAARSPLDLYYKEHYAASSSSPPEDDLFIQPWQVRSFLQNDLSSDTPSSPHPSYHKALSSLRASFRKLKISPQQKDLHLLPTIQAPQITSTNVFAPAIQSTPSLMGSWKGLVTDGIVLFTESWEQELFVRWPEVALRTFLSHHHNIPLQLQAIIIREERMLPLPEVHTIECWAEFASLVSSIPFPFTFDITKLLLNNPSTEEIVQAINKQAEGRVDLLSTFASSLSPDACSSFLPHWQRFATSLWSDFFTFVEGA